MDIKEIISLETSKRINKYSAYIYLLSGLASFLFLIFFLIIYAEKSAIQSIYNELPITLYYILIPVLIGSLAAFMSVIIISAFNPRSIFIRLFGSLMRTFDYMPVLFITLFVLLLFDKSGLADYGIIKVFIISIIVYFIMLNRLLESALRIIRKYNLSAVSIGTSEYLFVRKIIFPQLLPALPYVIFNGLYRITALLTPFLLIAKIEPSASLTLQESIFTAISAKSNDFNDIFLKVLILILISLAFFATYKILESKWKKKYYI